MIEANALSQKVEELKGRVESLRGYL